MIESSHGHDFSDVEGVQWLVDPEAVVSYARYAAAKQPRTQGQLVKGVMPLPVARLEAEPLVMSRIYRSLVQTVIDEIPTKAKVLSQFNETNRYRRSGFGWHIDPGSAPGGHYIYRMICNNTSELSATTQFAGLGTVLDPYDLSYQQPPRDFYIATPHVAYLFPANLTSHTAPELSNTSGRADLYTSTFGLAV